MVSGSVHLLNVLFQTNGMLDCPKIVLNIATILANSVSKFTTVVHCLIPNTRKYFGFQKVNFFVLSHIRLKILEYVHITVSIVTDRFPKSLHTINRLF